jgi:cytochrome P450 family 6
MEIIIILTLSTGLEDPNSEFFKQGKRLFELSPLEFLKFFFTSSCPDLARKMHLTANAKEPSDFLHKIFTQTIKEREEKNIQRNDFVQLLLKLRDSTTTSLTVDEMAAESFIFFTGG